MKIDCRVATLIAMTVIMFGLTACGNKAGLKSPEQIKTQEARQARKDAKDAKAKQQQAPAVTPEPTPMPSPAPAETPAPSPVPGS